MRGVGGPDLRAAHSSFQMNFKDQSLNFAWQETHASRTLP